MNDNSALIARTIRWTIDACKEIRRAGGSPELVLEKVPDDFLYVLVRNNLMIRYEMPK